MGVKLFAWLGGLALFFGVVFFVKYAFEHDLIPASAARRHRLHHRHGACGRGRHRASQGTLQGSRADLLRLGHAGALRRHLRRTRHLPFLQSVHRARRHVGRHGHGVPPRGAARCAGRGGARHGRRLSHAHPLQHGRGQSARSLRLHRAARHRPARGGARAEVVLPRFARRGGHDPDAVRVVRRILPARPLRRGRRHVDAGPHLLVLHGSLPHRRHPHAAG